MEVLPRNDLWLTVFADDIAMELRNVFRDLRRARLALDIVGIAIGFCLNPPKSVVINYTRHLHVAVQYIACDGDGLPVGSVGR